MTSSTETYYNALFIPRRGRPPRGIDAPRVALKVIQRWIHDWILPRATVHESATAFAFGRGIFANGQHHATMRNLLKMDIRDFFPSVSSEAVNGVYSGMGYGSEVAAQLTALTTLNGGLPQGAPTSPVLSNAIMFDIDVALARTATGWDAAYTRYADDIAFSSATHRFSEDDVQAVTDVLAESNFSPNDRKTKRIGGGYQHVVAGVSVSVVPMAPRSRRRAWRALFHQAAANPTEFVDRVDELTGIAGFIGQYSPGRAAQYAEVIDRVVDARRSQ
jgi:hypothetical protein